MSLYSIKQASPGTQAWISEISVGKSVFDFYDSQGDATISMATTISNFQGGPIVVRRYNNLTLSAQLTTTNRCRGLLLLVDGNLTINSGGDLSMTKRGAIGWPLMGLYDVLIPDKITVTSKRLSQRDMLASLRASNNAIIDRWMWDDWGRIDGVTATALTGAQVLLSASGCGAGGVGVYYSGSGISGTVGTAGTTAPGGSGCAYSGSSSGGAIGRPWGGGVGGGSQYCSITLSSWQHPDLWGGKGGTGTGSDYAGAGNPAGYGSASGTGGCLYVLVKGNILVNSGGIIEADGCPAPTASCPGGSSGGGFVSLVYGGTYTNSGTVRANGGAATAGSATGGAGGAGAVVAKTFAQMGWS